MVSRRRTLRISVNGESVAVPSIPHHSCPACGEVVLGFEEGQRLAAEAFARYRLEHGLLSADEIRALRESLGLTQAELARLLRLGANTISRWESGRNVQTGAMDVLLRMIRDVPGTIEYLRGHAA